MNDTTATIQQLKDQVLKFRDERHWRKFHNPKNLSLSILIEAAEIAEHFQWQRTEQEVDELLAIENEREAIGEEIADVCAYVLSLVDVLKIDLTQALINKLEKNKLKFPLEQWSTPDKTSHLADYLDLRRRRRKEK
jgi:NTP pyrophosphatase (non-canonical NTP hydrolase)